MSDLNPQNFTAYARRCAIIFGAVVCGTLIMVGASYAPISNRIVANAIILAGAVTNASVVGAYLMHLLTERRTIHALLAFTAIFFVGLMGLIVWSHYQIPAVAKH